MTNIGTTITNAKLLQKASAVKFGWLAMDKNSKWYWFSKKPKFKLYTYWLPNTKCDLANVKLLKLPKRSPSFAPNSLIKCTPYGPILLSTNQQYHRTWGMISIPKNNNIKKGTH